MKNSNKEYDEYELKMFEKLEILKKCQEENSINSCLKCKKIIGCEIRKSYVNAVYESMNKGKGGGFEF
ncbi:hypothetical protein [Nitrosophilus alvini]|uniref:hypothetical protein n=1 Tax=Nitrosophilus alvini TaxID=2714855 RepID=UPI00190C63B9|nr:hypothetical protein [Nitrosophilus alvini]